jgi:hypothetical protein
VALASGRPDEAIERLRRSVTYAEEYGVDQDPQVVLELIRVLIVGGGDPAEVERLRQLLHRGSSPLSQAYAAAADGVCAVGADEAVSSLRVAVEGVEAIEARIDLGRILTELGRAERRAGLDPRPSFERARQVLTGCGALFYLRGVEAELEGSG